MGAVAESYDAVKAKTLWEGSARLVGLPVQEITGPALQLH